MTDKNELPDGTMSKSTAKRVTALAAASVSERARELVSKMYGGAVAVGSDGQWVSVRRYLLDELESLLSGGSHA